MRPPSRRAAAVFAPLFALGVAVTGLNASPSIAYAADDQHGVAQVVLNPGGGSAADGSDGLRVVLNSTSSANRDDVHRMYASDASDQLWFADTVQFCCSGVGPTLNVGGTLFGESGAASDEAEEGWSSVSIVSTSGSAVTGTTLPATTGNGAATLRYTAVKDGLTYTIDRAVSYTYPNDYYRDSYTFTIPVGNTEPVKFYKGGDTSPGSDDQGYGIQLTSPVRSVISLNPASHIQVGQREIPGDKPFDGATSMGYYAPYQTIADGGDLGFLTETANHDAGFQTQWNLGSTPGTQTYAQETFVNFQGASLSAGFRSASVASGSSVLLDLNVVNTALSTTSGLGYTFTLPAGLTVASGTPANSCGGTLTAAAGGSTVVLSGGSAPAADNCLVSVPVVAAGGGDYAIGRASVTGLAALTNGVGTSSLTVTGPSAPSAPGAPTAVTAVADESSILVSWQPPAGGAPAARYRVTASPGSASCTTTELSCVLGGEAGKSYTISVVALAAGDVPGAAATVTTEAVDTPGVPAAPPADAPLTLTTTDGQITSAEPGQQITVVGSGFLPYSTVTIVVYSTPVTLGTVTTDGAGSFSKSVTIPAGLEAGSHSLLAYGVDPSGNDHSLRLNVTVAGAATEVAGTAATPATTHPTRGSSLAYTGSTFQALPIAVGGAALLAVGTALLLGARARRTRQDVVRSES